MHQPRLSHQSSLQGLLAPQAPVEVDWWAKERKRRRGSNRRRGRSGQGSRRLKDEVIRLDTYQLKDDNDDALSEHLGTAMSFLSFPQFQSYLCLLSERSYKSTPTRTLFGLGHLGAPLGGSTTPLFCFYFEYSFTFIWRNSFLPEQKGSLFL